MRSNRIFTEQSDNRRFHRHPTFLIVGTARSGTTLVQRFACELPGVRVPPETKFFWSFVPKVLRWERFPLEGARLDLILDAYVKQRGFEDLGFDVARVVAQMGGRCDSPFDLFGEVVRELAGEASIYGEKTPQHIGWWRPLCRAMPNLKLIAVVRDPRAVVASNLAVPWGKDSHVVLAERWSLDQNQILSAQRHLPATRFLLLRYEDVVTDPLATRNRLGEFLDVVAPRSNASLQPVAKEQIIRPEETWKDNVLGPVTTDRKDAWQETLSTREAREIVSICRAEMVRIGYTEAIPSRFQATMQLARLGHDNQLKRLRYRASQYKLRSRTLRIASRSEFLA